MTDRSGITALVLTFNEEANIERTLASVSWVDRILVVDSGSTDDTLELVRRFPNAEILSRKFTTFADQCNFGLAHIDTPWVLSMDADYCFPTTAAQMIREALDDGPVVGYALGFDYAICGRVVKGSILPPRTVLYRTSSGKYEDDGHGHRVNIEGQVKNLPMKIVHDDRKPLARWLQSQLSYAAIEAEKLGQAKAADLSTQDRIRRLIVIAPVLVFVLVYVVRGGVFSGWHGLFYALQRFFAELLLSLFLIDRKLSIGGKR